MAAEVQRMYCPECDENFTLGVESEEERLVVLCGCDGAQTLDSFIHMYYDQLDDGEDEGSENGGRSAGRRMFY